MPPILEQPDMSTSVRYSAQDPAKVQHFFAQHLTVKQLLLEAKAPLQHTFGKDVVVAVTVTSNLEMADGEFLVDSILTMLSAAQAHACLEAFDETWWLDNAPRAKGQLIFTVAFA
jgi:hypothetical protein